MSTTRYKEGQRFRQTWLILVVFSVASVSLYLGISELSLGNIFHGNSAETIPINMFGLVVGIVIPILILSSGLHTEVRNDGIYFKFFPFHMSFRIIYFDRLKQWKVVKFNPLLEYGGWGIRLGLNTKAYIVSGNRGVLLELKTGNKILIGSKKPEELANAIGLAAGRAE